MPRVPQSNVTQMLPPQKGGAEAPSPTMLAMAAAMMHAQGKDLSGFIHLAGDVVPLPITAGQQAGPNPQGLQYITGAKIDPQVKPIPIATAAGAIVRGSK